MNQRYLALIALMVAGLFIMAACGGDDPTSTPEATSTSTTTAQITSTPSGDGGSPTAEATASGTPSAGSPTAQASPGAEGSPTAEASPGGGSPTAGDPEAGEQVFNSNGCSGCHSTGSDTKVGPGLAGIGERAGTRVAGLTADEYIEQSLTDPQAFTVEGFPPGVMPSFDSLSDEDLANLIAYLKTLE